MASIRNNKGFTLIELLVVIAIIGTLSTIGFIALTSSQQGASDTVKVSDLQTVRSAIAIHYTSSSTFPAGTTACKLQTLTSDALRSALDGKVEGIDWDNIFYCTNAKDKDIKGGTSTGKAAHTEYVIGTTLGGDHKALTNDYEDTVLNNNSKCTDPIFCLKGGK